jgi:hypothetical protein
LAGCPLFSRGKRFNGSTDQPLNGSTDQRGLALHLGQTDNRREIGR